MPIGRTTSAGSVRQSLRRARVVFARFLLNQVAESLEAPTPDRVKAVSAHANVPDKFGVGEATVDFDLKRGGVWIEGKVTDKATGKPVHAYVDYFALGKNPNVKDYPGFEGTHSNAEHVKGRIVGRLQDDPSRHAGRSERGLRAGRMGCDGALTSRLSPASSVEHRH